MIVLPYAILVLIASSHECNSGPKMRYVPQPWPLSWFFDGSLKKVDPSEPEACEVWSVTVNGKGETIDTFDTMDACKIAMAIKDHYANGPLMCRRVEPPT